jgi:putative oxidoreductase
MNLNSLPRQVDTLLARVGGWLQSPLLLVIRAYWGWQFFLTGKGKLGDLSRPTAFFARLHIPHPHLNAIVVGSTECFGGLLLLAGLGTRFITPIFIFEMIVAYVTADPKAFHAFFSDPDTFTSASPFLFLYASVLIFVFGPGCFSLDALIFRKKQ